MRKYIAEFIGTFFLVLTIGCTVILGSPGVIPPLVTPLLERDTLDAAGLERLVEHVLGGGVSGLFVLGTSGEAPCLSYRLRRELVERAVAAGRMGEPVIQVLSQVQQRTEGERAWPLRWFLQTYPDSPFHADLASLIVESPVAQNVTRPASVRTAPTLP